jgi:LysM repeat protein
MGKKSLQPPALALVLVVLFLAGLAAFVAPAQAQDLGPNLLVNPSFEEGHYNQDGISEITVPNGWRMHWSNGEFIFGGEWPSARPETVVWNSLGGIPEGEEIFWRDGIYTMKVFKSWAPMWAAMSQDVSNLEVGRKYRFVVPIFIDIFEDFQGGQKIIPQRKDTGRVRLGASPVGAAWRDENAIAYSGWWTGETVDPFFQAYPTFIYDFVATQPNMTVWIEMASTYPHPNNGFFFDLPGLFATNETAAVAQPAPPPAAQTDQGAAAPAAPVAQAVATTAPPPTRDDGSVVHVVQAGESLWGIAIRYAQAMGLTAEAALPVIQELNNNPAFINPGDELLIIAASTTPTAEPAVEGEGEDSFAGDEAVSDETDDAAADTGEETSDESAALAIDATQPAEIAGTICVATFNDANADGQRNENETLVANAAIAISLDGRTVSTYITDGTSEPYCFELAEAGSYQLQLYPPAGFGSTTEDNWAVAIGNGESYTVSFGLTENLQEVALRSAPAADTAAVDEAAVAAETATEDAAGGLSSNLGIIVLAVAGVLLLLAGVGVVLLRRG